MDLLHITNKTYPNLSLLNKNKISEFDYPNQDDAGDYWRNEEGNVEHLDVSKRET